MSSCFYSQLFGEDDPDQDVSPDTEDPEAAGVWNVDHGPKNACRVNPFHYYEGIHHQTIFFNLQHFKKMNKHLQYQ